ncbi:T9SS type A sorting domain-containing protein [Flavobacterium sp. XS1P32]|uniref:T9SS type A sorting domain-containing protein n=1 Tax=unclassified Flavobacterium TaxID=196869 RepID=UPI003AACF76E
MKTKLLLMFLFLTITLQAQTNLVPNGNFEKWTSSSQPDKWFRSFSGLVLQSSSAQNGSSSTKMQITSGTFNFINSEFFPVVAGKTYRITMYHKLVTGTFSAIDLSLYHQPGTFKTEITKKTDAVTSSTEWRKIEFDYTPTASESIEVDIWTTGTLNSKILVDNVSVVDVATIGATYTLIPDLNFEKRLIALGHDSGSPDGKVLTSSIASVTSLDVSSSSITDLKGIQDFVSLKTLYCYSNKLTILDISKNLALTNLHCNGNQLTTLDLSKNVALKEIISWDNKLTSIDLSKNVNLTTLECSFNKLTSLDVSQNLALTTLNCGYNQLTTLDLSGYLPLKKLFCYANQITSLDLSKIVNLTALSCYGNQLTTLDLSKNLALKELDFYANKLTSIDLSNNLELSTLECQQNLLTTLDLSKNIALIKLGCAYNPRLEQINLKNGNNTNIKPADLFIKNNLSLYCIIVDDVSYSTTNWSTNKDQHVEFTNTQCATPQYTLIPDINFEKALIKLNIDGVEDGKVLTRTISNIKNLDLSTYDSSNIYYKIKDLTGIQDFSSLEVLKLPNNKEITSIDLSKNLLLKVFDCNQSKLASLDVAKNLFLSELYCEYNKITSLDLSQNTALTKLNFSYNSLTNIDLSQNIALNELNCSANRLTILNVNKNKALTRLIAAGSSQAPYYTLQQGLLTSIDLSQNLALEYLDFSYNEKVVGLDVSKNKNLWYIDVDRNALTSIDFSANTLLKILSCEANKLTSIDLSKYPVLEALICDFNQLKSIDLSQKITLKHLSIDGNQLTSLDVSKNSTLERLYCGSNQLTNLDVSKNSNLLQLTCGSNKLVKLNLKNGNNSKMDEFMIFRNNPNLNCILVDDVTYSNSKWTTYKDSWATFNTECSFLPSNNFAIESKGETCLNTNNGEINITATVAYGYKATINATSYTFTNNSLKVTNLAPGSYNVTITIPGETFEQIFTINIPKGANITGKSSKVAEKIAVEIATGTAPYTVFLNGVEQFETNATSFTVDAKTSGLLEVKTAKACEGIYAKEISALDGIFSAFPNPTSGAFEIEIPTTNKEVSISIFTLEGKLISNKKYSVGNGKVQLSLDDQPAGIYMTKVELGTPQLIKIIKK